LTSENANIGDSQEEGDKEGLLRFHNAWAMIDSLDERRYENGGSYRDWCSSVFHCIVV